MNVEERFEALNVEKARRADVGKWLALLTQWNARIDLTAARTDDELVDLMLADAVLLAKHVPEGARVVDVGSGAGAPGLALALLRPDLKMTLAEPLKKRVAFLRTVIGSVNRVDVELLPERGETVLAARGAAWDVAISRATLAPEAWADLGLALASSTWVLLAKEEPPNVAGASRCEDLAYTWPLTGASRRAVRYVKTVSFGEVDP